MKNQKKAGIGILFLLSVGLLLSACGAQPPAAVSEEESAVLSGPSASSGSGDESRSTTTVSSPTDRTTLDKPETTSTPAPTTTTSAYVPPSNGPEKLSAEQEKKIREDYFNFLPSDKRPSSMEEIYFQNYRGTYEGAELVLMGREGVFSPDVNEDLTVAGYDFTMPSPGYLLHKGNTFYEIADAYEKGVITKEGVRAIQWYNPPSNKITD